MAPKFYKHLISQTLFLVISIAQAQQSIKQYLHVTGVGPHSPSAGLAALPTVGVGRPAVPNTGLTTLSALALPGLISALQQSAAVTTPMTSSPGLPTLKTQQPITTNVLPSMPTSKQATPSTNTPNGGLDSNVLNNLAIALQLLIVSNILNSAPEGTDTNPIYEMLETVKTIPVSLSQTESKNSYPAPTQQDVYEAYMPNANFVGSSGFADNVITDPYIKNSYDYKAPNTRNSFQLMSPYEALGPNSPYSDPILNSPYGSIISSKKDFQSPYMMQEDLFSMSDVF